MGRRHRPVGASHLAAALTVLATLAPATGQQEPEHWQQFAAWRAELAADAPTALLRWQAKADARLAWMHGFVTGDRPREQFARWLLADAAATLRSLHALQRPRPATDWTRTLGELTHFVAHLKDLGRFDDAADFLDGLLGWLPDDRHERFDFLLQLAECQRRAYRWDLATRTLAAATGRSEAAGAGLVALHVQRSALLLARGLPDLAVAEIEAAERAGSDPWQRAQALFVRLRLEHALRRPAQAMARWREFLAAPLPPDLASDPAWAARLTQLRIRVALAVLADPAIVSPDAGQAAAWLRAAIDEPTTTVDERSLARTVLISHLLDRGELHGVDELLAAGARETTAGPDTDLDERRLAMATLSLRHARLAKVTGEALRARGAELDRLWQLLVDRWHDQPLSRLGEGPLFFGDCRRAFVELLRWRLAGDDAAQAAQQALDEVVRASAAGSLARRLGAAAPPAAEIRSRLCGAGTGILVFVPGHEVSLAFAIDDAAITAHVLDVGALGLDAARRELLHAVEAARRGEDAAALEHAARECARLLLPPPVAARLSGWRRLAIVGRESLGYLPFELLPDAGGTRLGASHAVNYLPSLPVGAWLAAHRPGEPAAHRPRVRVLACPDTPVPEAAPERPAPLAFAEADLDPWRQACAGIDLDIRRGAQATPHAAFDGGAAVDFVQVLAHGIRDETRGDPQGILLGDGTITWPADLEASSCPRHVFLNVCRAGRGRLRRGDDGRHLLSGALLVAGARAVVLPVVDVGYRATIAFAADVHHGLWQQRLDLAEALRRARVAALARNDRHTLDAFLFHLVGLGDVMLASAPADAAALRPPTSRALVVGLATGIGAVVLAAILVLRRRHRQTPESAGR